ncbi:MAG: hypothetical protein FWE27_02925 [Defluviitaleaceae bacterium]|nr:hypothetical protein [Defluviitaleaceae bacterium]
MLKKCFRLFLLSALTAIALSLSGCGAEKCQANNDNHPGFSADTCTRTPVQGSNYCRFHICGLEEDGCKNRNGMPVAALGTPGDIECGTCS